jgi:hypothetical protein
MRTTEEASMMGSGWLRNKESEGLQLVQSSRTWLQLREARLGLGGECLATAADSHAYFMADISSLTFTLRATDANVRGRAVRRIFLSDHALKLAKLFAGDVVALTATSDIYKERVRVPLQSKMRCRKFIAFPSRDTSP